MSIFVGCSGYYYPAWTHIFYPPELKPSQWLAYYAQHFNTIEINSSFYRFPTADSIRKRYDATPSSFMFSLKAPKMLTHIKKMQNITHDLQQICITIKEGLQEKVGCLLFQFPASWTYSWENLMYLMQLQHLCVTPVVEFRHHSWRNQEVYTVLGEAGITFCNSSYPDLEDSYVSTPLTLYLRLHGKQELFKSAYGIEGLNYWLSHLKREQNKTVYVYCNNTRFAEALQDARIVQQYYCDH